MTKRTNERRNGPTNFHVPERRTGFDRRNPPGILARLAENDMLFLLLAATILLMSTADWMFTLRALRSGAIEGNPILATLMGVNPLAAASFKAAATLLAVWLMWMGRKYRLMVATSLFAFVVYFALIAYHLGGLAGLGAI